MGVVLATLFVALGVIQVSGTPQRHYEVVGSKSDYLHVLLSTRRGLLGTAAITSQAGMAQYSAEFVEIEELPDTLQLLCINESNQLQPEDSKDETFGVSLRVGWPLRIELLGGRTKGWPWDFKLGWFGVSLVRDNQPVGSMPYRPALLPLLANILLFALPIVLLFGFVRCQIALVRAARANCPSCGYPRPKTTCPECGRTH